MFENIITNPYLRAVLLFAILFLAIKVAVWLFVKIFTTIVPKTKVHMDGILTKRLGLCISAVAFLISAGIALREITLGAGTQALVHNIFGTITVIVTAYVIYAIVETILIHQAKKFSSKLDSDVLNSLSSVIYSILKLCLILVACMYMLSLWGIEIGPMLAALGIAGLAVALALQPTLSNIFSGASVVLDKTVSLGDMVYVNPETKGRIQKIGLRSTRLVSTDNDLFIVPNSILANSIIQNVTTYDPKSRAVIAFTIDKRKDIEKVKKIVINEIKKVKHLQRDTQPYIRFVEMSLTNITFKVYFYIESYDFRSEVIDEANTRLYNALTKYNITIQQI